MKTLDRNSLLKDGATMIAECNTHSLMMMPGKTRDGWFRLVLLMEQTPAGYNGRRVWWLTHSGKSVVANSDSRHLQENFQEIYEWAVAELGASGELSSPKARRVPQVEKSATGWRVVVGNTVIADNLTNSEAWLVADRQTDFDRGMEDTRKRIQTASVW